MTYQHPEGNEGVTGTEGAGELDAHLQMPHLIRCLRLCHGTLQV